MRRGLGIAAAGLLAMLAPAAVSQPAADPVGPESPIRLNTIGFLPDGPKRALVPDRSTTPLPWRLLDGNGAVRAEGVTAVLGDDAPSGEHLHLVDFSSFTVAGRNYVLAVGDRRSRPFKISAHTYARLPFDALAYFYHNRASISIEARFAGGEAWARPAGHAPDRASCISGRDQDGNRWDGCPYTLDVSRGWYDAGDHGKYVVNAGISVWTLLDLYERQRLLDRPHQFRDGSAAIPEAGNGVDDLLDEVRWELDFLLAMQVPDGTRMRLPVGQRRSGPNLRFTEVDASGMVHHKVADERWTRLPMPPHLDRERRFLHPPSTGATLNLAAVAAQCARIWREIDPAFSARCLAAAERAWRAAARNPEIHAIANFTGSGAYGDNDLGDEFFWAAAELFVTTRNSAYAEELRRLPYLSAAVQAPGWASTATLGLISLALVPNSLGADDVPAIRARIRAAADGFLEQRDRLGYRVPFPPPYVWGSTSNLLNRAILLALAYDFSGDARYRGGVVDSMDFLLGRNPLDRSFVSGYGARPMRNPHHRFWAHSMDPNLPEPPPGVLSGGPNSSGRQDEVAREIFGRCAPQTCWRDDIRAFSLNEVAINWNAALVWVSAFLAEPAR